MIPHADLRELQPHSTRVGSGQAGSAISGRVRLVQGCCEVMTGCVGRGAEHSSRESVPRGVRAVPAPAQELPRRERTRGQLSVPPLHLVALRIRVPRDVLARRRRCARTLRETVHFATRAVRFQFVCVGVGILDVVRPCWWLSDVLAERARMGRFESSLQRRARWRHVCSFSTYVDMTRLISMPVFSIPVTPV